MRKKPVRAAKARTAKAKPAKPAPEWDVKAEAAAAKAAALAKQGKGKLIEAPAGAIVIPGVSKRKRVKPEPVAMEPVRETRKERRAALRAEIAAEDGDAVTKVERLLAEAKAADRVPINDEKFLDMLTLLATGITLREICRMPGMPSRWAFHQYVNCGDEQEADRRAKRLARAREMFHENVADETMAIIDDSSNDYVERMIDGVEVRELDREHIARSKLRAEMRLKLLALWDPARYGARVNHGDADGKPLRGNGMTASDLAIGLSKLVEAARRNDLSLPAAERIVDVEPRE